MSLYPTLEDMKVDQMAQAQIGVSQQYQQQVQPQIMGASSSGGSPAVSSLYPTLDDYMGMQISSSMIQKHMPETAQDVVAYQPGGAMQRYVAPITGDANMGMMRSEVKQGVRQIICCKDQHGKVGIRVQHINKGVFVSLVQAGSPAAIAGLRFGDQLLQINGTTLAGFDRDKVFALLKKADPKRIEFALRDRPFERTITLQKDSVGHVGFIYKDGQVNSIVKDSSAARNGLLIEHAMLEVNGQNVVGLKDKEISKILSDAERSMTLTIMPTFIYEHMMKSISSSLVKKKMDHSIPDL